MNAKSKSGNTPFMLAQEQGHAEEWGPGRQPPSSSKHTSFSFDSHIMNHLTNTPTHIGSRTLVVKGDSDYLVHEDWINKSTYDLLSHNGLLTFIIHIDSRS